MLITNKSRNLHRKTTQKLKVQLPQFDRESTRRASCCCNECGKLSQFQLLHQNLQLVVQYHSQREQVQLKSKPDLKKLISTSFHLPPQQQQNHSRRKSCECDDCGPCTKFQKSAYHKIPTRPQRCPFKSFIIRKSLGSAFKEVSDIQNTAPSTMTPRSNREIVIKHSHQSPVLTKLEMSRQGKAFQQIFQSKAYKQHQELRRLKTENSPQNFKTHPTMPCLQAEYHLSKFSRMAHHLTPITKFKSTIN